MLSKQRLQLCWALSSSIQPYSRQPTEYHTRRQNATPPTRPQLLGPPRRSASVGGIPDQLRNPASDLRRGRRVHRSPGHRALPRSARARRHAWPAAPAMRALDPLQQGAVDRAATRTRMVDRGRRARRRGRRTTPSRTREPPYRDPARPRAAWNPGGTGKGCRRLHRDPDGRTRSQPQRRRRREPRSISARRNGMTDGGSWARRAAAKRSSPPSGPMTARTSD